MVMMIVSKTIMEAVIPPAHSIFSLRFPRLSMQRKQVTWIQ